MRLLARQAGAYAAVMAQIILDRVEKTYPGGVKAVDDLSLDVRDGEFMVLVGPWTPSSACPCGPRAASYTRYLQFFDPSSGLSIGHPKASAAVA